jgi:hypothetical protein
MANLTKHLKGDPMRTERPTHIIVLAFLGLLAFLAPAMADDDAAGDKPVRQKIKVGEFDINELPKEVYDAVMDKIWEEGHQEPPIETRLYDIGTLLMTVPDYTFAWFDESAFEPNTMNTGCLLLNGGGDIFENCDEDGDESQGYRVRELITRCVRAQGPREAVWEDEGGRASIMVLEDERKLLVSTTAESHLRVEKILAMLSRTQPGNVTVQVTAVGFKAAFARRLMLDGTYVADTPAKREALLGAMETVHDCATLAGKNGQKLTHNAGELQYQTTDVEPVVAEGATGWDPCVKPFFDGLSVRVEASLETGGAAARLDYSLHYSRTTGAKSDVVEATAGGGTCKVTVDKPKMVYNKKAGTVTLLLDTPTVITGGMVPAVLVADEANAKGKVPLYYVITVRQPAGSRKEAATGK